MGLRKKNSFKGPVKLGGGMFLIWPGSNSGIISEVTFGVCWPRSGSKEELLPNRLQTGRMPGIAHRRNILISQVQYEQGCGPGGLNGQRKVV